MRINFLGGPGVGKSTTAAWVFSELKKQGFSVEHVSEFVKAWAYQKRTVQKFDQVYLFGKQQQYEYRYLAHGVKNIVTDSPCILSVVYSNIYDHEVLGQAIQMLCMEYDKDHPCFNIILDRGDKPYDDIGRWQTAEEAKIVDHEIEGTVRWLYPENLILKVNYTEQDKILAAIVEKMDR